MLFSIVTEPFYIPTSKEQDFQFPHIINTCYFFFFFFFDSSYPNWYEVGSLCGFELYFPNE